MARGHTTIINRIVFGIFALITIAGFLEMPYHEAIGHGALPFIIWTAFFGLAILGFVLTTVKGEIKFRLHKVWTTIGIFLIIFTLTTFYVIDTPGYKGPIDALLHNGASTEAIPYLVGFGLLLAFIDTDVFYRYAYFYTTLTAVDIALIAVYAMMLLPKLLSGRYVEFENILDIFWFLSGFIFAYYIVKRFRAHRHTRKQIGMAVGGFILALIILAILSKVVASILPQTNWFVHWVSMNQPN